MPRLPSRFTAVHDRAILDRGRNGQTLVQLASVLGISKSSLGRREQFLMAQNAEREALARLPLVFVSAAQFKAFHAPDMSLENSHRGVSFAQPSVSDARC